MYRYNRRRETEIGKTSHITVHTYYIAKIEYRNIFCNDAVLNFRIKSILLYYGRYISTVFEYGISISEHSTLTFGCQHHFRTEVNYQGARDSQKEGGMLVVIHVK